MQAQYAAANFAIFCSPGAVGGLCVFGKCNANGTMCLCDEGYEWDTVQSFFPTCCLSAGVKRAMYSSIIVCSFLVILWALWELRQAAFDKRRLLYLVIASQLMCSIYVMVNWIVGVHSWGPSVCLALTLFLCGSCGMYTIRLFVAPMAAFSPLSLVDVMKRLDRMMIAQCLGFFVVSICFLMPACAKLATLQIEHFNNIFSYYFFGIFALCVSNWLITSYAKNNAMAVLTMPTIWRLPVALSFAKNIQLLDKLLGLSAVAVGALAIIIVSLQFNLKVYPWRFVLWWLLLLIFPFFGACSVLFAYLKLENAVKRPSRKRRRNPHSLHSSNPTPNTPTGGGTAPTNQEVVEV